MQQYPEPVVGAFIFNKNGEILLVKSHKWKDKYVIPGGHVEVGETLEAALKRETKEETGLDVFDPHFICIHEFIEEKGYHKKKQFKKSAPASKCI